MRSLVCSFSTKSKIWEKQASRDDGIEVTLLPIPNRKVKVYSADGTARVTVWESRTLRGNLKGDSLYYLFFLCVRINSHYNYVKSNICDWDNL